MDTWLQVLANASDTTVVTVALGLNQKSFPKEVSLAIVTHNLLLPKALKIDRLY